MILLTVLNGEVADSLTNISIRGNATYPTANISYIQQSQVEAVR